MEVLVFILAVPRGRGSVVAQLVSPFFASPDGGVVWANAGPAAMNTARMAIAARSIIYVSSEAKIAAGIQRKERFPLAKVPDAEFCSFAAGEGVRAQFHSINVVLRTQRPLHNVLSFEAGCCGISHKLRRRWLGPCRPGCVKSGCVNIIFGVDFPDSGAVMAHVTGASRYQATLFPEFWTRWLVQTIRCQVIDAFVNAGPCGIGIFPRLRPKRWGSRRMLQAIC